MWAHLMWWLCPHFGSQNVSTRPPPRSLVRGGAARVRPPHDAITNIIKLGPVIYVCIILTVRIISVYMCIYVSILHLIPSGPLLRRAAPGQMGLRHMSSCAPVVQYVDFHVEVTVRSSLFPHFPICAARAKRRQPSGVQ